MSAEILALEPKSLWKNFANLNAVPRASKKEERMQFLVLQKKKNVSLNLPKTSAKI